MITIFRHILAISIYQLSGEVELDEAFFPIQVPEESADEILLGYSKSQTDEIAAKYNIKQLYP